MTHETDFAERLVAEFPGLTPVLTKHLSDEEGELLPYLFFGEVARWLGAQTVTPRADDATNATDAVLAWLEDEYVLGSFDVRNLIDVGIVEMLPASPAGDPLLELLGPNLRERAKVAGLL